MTSVLAVATSPTDAVLAQLQDLRTRLAELGDVADAKDAAEQAEAINSWVRVARLRGVVAFEAAELEVRAQRRCGQLLLDYIRDFSTERSRARPRVPTGSLERFGISTNQSAAWQRLGLLPDDEFELRLNACRDAGQLPSTAAFLRAAARFARWRKSKITPTLALLRRALKAMREVRTLTTPAEVSTAKQIAMIGADWLEQIEARESKERARSRGDVIERTTTCLLCGRVQPPNKPERCPACGGQWFTC